jgi:chemotaxis protein methyltransferase CheR
MASPAGRPEPRGRGEGMPETVEDVEVDLLLEGIHRHYAFDFRQYARASLRRRLWRRMMEERVHTLSGLQERVLHDPEVMERLLVDLSINVTAMFRDPSFFLAVRRRVVPLLRTYPFVRIWNAGCATGEEAYSMAIVLAEEGLYDRARIYATDINEHVIDRAREGVFPLEKMREYTENYLRAGGTEAFSSYYAADPGGARFDPDLRRNLVFAQHNLVSDRSFNEFHVILCRNVMIYFAKPLQDRVFRLFHESLSQFGILALGHKESMRFSPHEDSFEVLDAEERIYRRVR